ncbi:unnamed protein product [Parascedosporium putredinis]|uniref:RNA helicase n=1 Tax=Parascedosporium putredinis TaxID=1442378 RepID=A0A9P1GZ89_9PEZI|nr:unnamed protein product [Parascedosporium putredinis]CAI7990630.1 unnamed protein product [Parascedosporium putredinis]
MVELCCHVSPTLADASAAAATNGITTQRARPLSFCSACYSNHIIATATSSSLQRVRNRTNLAPLLPAHPPPPWRRHLLPTHLYRHRRATRQSQPIPRNGRRALQASRAFETTLAKHRKEMNSFGIASPENLKKEEQAFMRELKTAFDMAENGRLGSRISLFNSLRLAFIRGDPVTDAQRQLADLRFPWEWFPATRALQRTVHVHIGPTNSGKTYHALKALENAESGVYCGPLRLLAHEVYTRLNAKGKPCALVTGEEQRYPKDTDKYYISCTVEMTPTNQVMDVAVIDEIQMIADPDRGSAWTAAFLGVQAKEVHLCGEERTVDLIQSLCASIGDTCIGDCIVAFSRLAIHSLKAGIERRTGRRCAVIYGSLPPETRAQQAALFNDPDNEYDFLVASDAIGMGLNLEIKRVVFESVTKHDGFDWRTLTISEIRQIGGRAGRYKTARHDLVVDDGTATETAEEEKVGRHDHPAHGLYRAVLDLLFPDTPLSFILMRMRELASVTDRFQLCIRDGFLTIADSIQEFPLSIYDRLVLMTAPVSLRTDGGPEILRAIARCIAERAGGHLLAIQEIRLELLEVDLAALPSAQKTAYLQQLEALHQAVVLYLWVSYRFPASSPPSPSRSTSAASSRTRSTTRSHAKDMLGAEAAEAVQIEEGPGRWEEEGHEEPLAQTPEEISDLAKAENASANA